MTYLFVEDADRYGNKVMSWFREHKPGIVSVIERLGIIALNVTSVSWSRIRLEFLLDDMPITRQQAVELGVTEEELKDFDEQIDNDHLVSVVDWQICEYPLE